jgi:predicted XRE-type DNA-binding protein
MSQNLFELFTDDPVESNIKNLKSKIHMSLINLIRQKGWTQLTAAKELNVSQPRMSNLFKGQLSKFSIDTLLEMLVRLGYKIDTDFDPTNELNPLTIKIEKKGETA